MAETVEVSRMTRFLVTINTDPQVEQSSLENIIEGTSPGTEVERISEIDGFQEDDFDTKADFTMQVMQAVTTIAQRKADEGKPVSETELARSLALIIETVTHYDNIRGSFDITGSKGGR